MNNLRQHEKDESRNLHKIVEQMNNLHAQMGGRDSRPERKALTKAIIILQKEIERGDARRHSATMCHAPHASYASVSATPSSGSPLTVRVSV